MKVLAIIPARGGSKRIPGKNIKNFYGKPIIAYPIQAALDSGFFDTVMVSTDSDQIANVAKQYGAEVPFMRSNKNADDYSTTADVLLEVLESYKAKQNLEFDYLCCIYPTAPFTTADLLKEGYHTMIKNDFDSVFPVLQYSFPIQRAMRIEEGKLQMRQPGHLNSRSQDLVPYYHDSGQFYWLNIPRFLEQKVMWGKNTGMIQLSEMDAHDIDTLEDWAIAEDLIHKFKNTQKDI